jgi:regulatory protein
MRHRTNRSSDKTAEVKALEILSFKMRSEKELHDKLVSYGYSEDEIVQAIAYVKSYGYVNDEKYAEQYVASRGKQKGRSLIRMELLKKGISPDAADRALEMLETDEDDTAYELLLKKAGEPHSIEEKEHARLYRFLAGRGFSNGAVYSALKRYKNEAE